MRVAQLGYHNFKGHSSTFDLAPVTVVAGVNFTHKTTIPLAIRLALTGYLPPPLGVRNLYSLAGDPQGIGEMAINLTLDNGRVVKWLWQRNAEGKVSVTGAVSPDIAMPELLMEPRLFFAQTGSEQVRTVFRACRISPQEFNPEIITRRFGEIQVHPMEVCEAVLRELSQWISAHPAENIPTWIDQLVDYITTKGKQARDDMKMASGAFQAFRTADAPTMQKDVSKELAAAREKLAALAPPKVTPDGIRSQLEMVKYRLVNYQKPEFYTQEIGKLANVLVGFPDLTGKPLAEVLEEITQAREKIQAYSKAAGMANGTVETLKQQHQTIEDAVDCPLCHAKKKGWQKAALADVIGRLGKAIAERDSATKQVELQTTRMEQLEQWSQATQELARLQKAQAELKGLLQTIAEMESKLVPQQDGPEQAIARAAVQTEIAALETQQRQYELYAKDRERKNNLEVQLLAAQSKVEVYKALYKLCTQETEKLIGTAFTRVLTVARHFTDGLLNSPLEFVEGNLGRRVGPLDRTLGCQAPIGSWIPFQTFSGTEELLALAGFGVALCHDAPIRLVILDELGRLDGRRKLDVTLRMLSLVDAGVINQAILVDVDPRPFGGLIGRKNFRLITL